MYCKRFEPKLTDEVIIMLKKFYASILKESDSKASPRLGDSLYNCVISLARLKGKSEVDTKDAEQIMAFFQRKFKNRIDLEVMIPREPIEEVKEIIVRRIKGTECYYYLRELLSNLYEEEEQIKEYFGSDKPIVLNQSKNKKFRLLAEWCEGDPRIKLLDKGRLKIAWSDSYKDSRGGKRDGAGRHLDTNATTNDDNATIIDKPDKEREENKKKKNQTAGLKNQTAGLKNQTAELKQSKPRSS